MSVTQLSFAAFAQSSVCPPPPASANGSVRSLAAPAEPGVGVGTPLSSGRPSYPGDCRLVLAKGAGPGVWNRWDRVCGGQRYHHAANWRYAR